MEQFLDGEVARGVLSQDERDFIVNYIREEGMPPTNREIGTAMKIASTGHVDYHLTMLEKIGTRPELPGRELRSRSGAMKLTGWIMIEAWLGAAVPAAAANWADDKSFSNSEYAQSKAICRSLKGLSLPATDGPDRAAAEALKGCSSEKLYYGIGMPPDPERARQCAYLERTARDGGGFSGGGGGFGGGGASGSW